jgi:CRP-like cAMP-binding protein
MTSLHLSEELALLSELEVFAAFEKEALQIIAFSSDVRQMRAGDILFRKGQISDCGYLILSGAVTFEAGERALFGRGALLGETALFAPTERPGTATMREDGAVMRISRSLVLRVFETFPETARRAQARFAAEAGESLDLLGSVVRILQRVAQPAHAV